MELTPLETELLAACRIALRQLDYDGDDKTAFAGATYDALTRAIAKAELWIKDDPAGRGLGVCRSV
jgi:hypothetical protein